MIQSFRNVERQVQEPVFGWYTTSAVQLYYSYYMRTSGLNFLLESYTFYDAIHGTLLMHPWQHLDTTSMESPASCAKFILILQPVAFLVHRACIMPLPTLH